jgi:hypothetical protein
MLNNFGWGSCKGLDPYLNGLVYRAIATGDLMRDVIVVGCIASYEITFSLDIGGSRDGSIDVVQSIDRCSWYFCSIEW